MIRQSTPGKRILNGVLALFCLPVGGAVALLGISAGIAPEGPRLLAIGMFFAGTLILLLGFQASGRAVFPAGVGGMDPESMPLLRIVSWFLLSFLLGVCGGPVLLFLVLHLLP